jgi:hypothetical protein
MEEKKMKSLKMQKALMSVVLSCMMFSFFIVSNNAFSADELVVADFDMGDKPNNLGGDFGAWDKDPNDTTQGCKMSFEYGDDALGKADGFSLRLDYDIDSPNPAYNGFWTKLEGEDFSGYTTLNIYIKGDKAKGFTNKVKIELKDFQKTANTFLEGITDKWQKLSIPLESFKGIDLKSMNELVLVFDDVNSNPKVGSVLIDQVSVSK